MDYVGVQFDERQIAEAKTLGAARWLSQELEDVVEADGIVALKYYADLIVSELSELLPDGEHLRVVEREIRS